MWTFGIFTIFRGKEILIRRCTKFTIGKNFKTIEELFNVIVVKANNILIIFTKVRKTLIRVSKGKKYSYTTITL